MTAKDRDDNWLTDEEPEVGPAEDDEGVAVDAVVDDEGLVEVDAAGPEVVLRLTPAMARLVRVGLEHRADSLASLAKKNASESYEQASRLQRGDALTLTAHVLPQLQSQTATMEDRLEAEIKVQIYGHLRTLFHPVFQREFAAGKLAGSKGEGDEAVEVVRESAEDLASALAARIQLYGERMYQYGESAGRVALEPGCEWAGMRSTGILGQVAL